MNCKSPYIFLISLFSLLTLSCIDDNVYDPNYVGDGEADVKAEVYFTAPNPTLSRAVEGGTPGGAIKSINNVCVLCYTNTGTLVRKYYFPEVTTEETDANPSDRIPELSTNPNAEGEHRAETKTVKTTLTLEKVPYGRYCMYAIANVADDKLTDDVVKDLNKVKELQLNWVKDEIPANDQMFGYFSDDNTSKGFEAPVIIVNKPNLSFHAWVKRAVSKVTIAFDARNLKENIYIYLKTAQIKDIPAHCFLGKDNEPGSYPEDGELSDMNELIQNGQTIKYVEDPTSTTYNESWTARISAGRPIYGFNTDALGQGTYAEQIAAQHGEDVNALYFYENMQGTGEAGTASDKWQVVEGNENKTVPSYPNGNTEPVESDPNTDPEITGFKDAKPYGSYIEVQAYYISNNSGDISRGNIIYRFMLGKDTHLDFNAERNHHYKLTMRFNGYANDVDWHIVYPREPGIEHPNPYYISYLYNHAMSFPLQINTAPGVRVTGLSATITSNNWAPKDPGSKFIEGVNSVGEKKTFPSYWFPAEDPTLYPWNGFLSLHQVETQVITKKGPWAMDANKATYEEAPKRGDRTYFSGQNDIQTGSYTIDMQTGASGAVHASDKYSVDVSGSEGNGFVYKFTLPMYTRAKQMIKQTGFTGNNPYSAYYREAKVHIIATLSNGKTYDSDVPILQVPRCVNPKGVYRDATSSKSFNVVLKKLVTEEGTAFEDIISDGPWRAYVLLPTNSDDVCTLSGDEETTTEKIETIEYSESDADPVRYITVKSIHGKTGSTIDFNINFKANKTGDAIIRVEYNNFSCYHLIFVKKGDNPVQLVTGGAKWYITNQVSQDTRATSPCEEGSLFKWNNWKAIEAAKNKNGRAPWVNIIPDDFIKNAAGQGPVGTLTLEEWNGISYNDITYKASWKDPLVLAHGTFDGAPNQGRIAEEKDYQALFNDGYIEQGYGVLYDDGATSTKNDIYEAYEHSTTNTNRGMRGCFVYNKKTGANLFFPIGASGYGHRKSSVKRPNSGITVDDTAGPDSGENPVLPPNTTTLDDTNSTTYYGVLRYSSNPRWGYFNLAWDSDNYPQAVNDAPLFYDIFKSPGAVYWMRSCRIDDNPTGGPYEDGDMDSVCAWDFNYYTLDFFPLTAGNLGNGGDACFIRCVQD